MPNELKPCSMFIELTDSYGGKNFCININFIKTVSNNGRYTLICTADSQHSVYETYDEIVKKIKQATEAWNRRADNA